MGPLEVVGTNVRLLREQLGLSQAVVAEMLHVDPTAVLRIEKAQRDVRVQELLLLAKALLTHPGALLAPPGGETLDVNGSSMDAGQVLAWFASDAVAAEMPQRDRGYFEDRGELNHVAQTLLEMVEKVQTAIEVEDSIGLLHELVNVAQYASGTAAYRMARARRSRPASTSGEG